MSEVNLNVMLIGKTQISQKFAEKLAAEAKREVVEDIAEEKEAQAIALTAIRTCYSANKPTEIVVKEGDKYFGRSATDGEVGTEADRLIRHIMRSKHTSTIEHLTYNFAVEGLSRSALSQLTRHRFFSFSVQSQRYVKFGSDDRTGGFDYVMPPSVLGTPNSFLSKQLFKRAMKNAQESYDKLRERGVPAEDARFVLPNAAACNIVMTGNLRAILDFYSKRKKGRGAQWEIADLADQIRAEVIEADPWTEQFFEEV
ncbi:FAD-dependent thymidylate synthase [Melghirimyces algeriensis]|uniref:Flavin-dependent thymidylate synthase n=1 Tax=Melghirimyces algeriensis TaxID=910412 RepID=A0A521F763_9BACL|nr:FAD-dependent thymidylate synthase [Melghirimyces algeriensis]SMO92048.1 thymidylate synthase (FAD) [Melghirimyces algeriensis]